MQKSLYTLQAWKHTTADGTAPNTLQAPAQPDDRRGYPPSPPAPADRRPSLEPVSGLYICGAFFGESTHNLLDLTGERPERGLKGTYERLKAFVYIEKLLESYPPRQGLRGT